MTHDPLPGSAAQTLLVMALFLSPIALVGTFFVVGAIWGF